MKNDYATRKDLKETVEQAVVDIVTAVSKTLENFATKDDLKNFATKDDLKNFATKDDLKNLATKDDVKAVENRLDRVESELKREINDLKADTPTPQEFQNHEKRILRLENAILP